VVDDVLLVDDCSDDDTVAIAKQLGIRTIRHPVNLGYGANQKTCYRDALDTDADIIVMLHADYQYDPRLITAMAGMIESGLYQIVLGSRILGGGARRGGMPAWKYVANRLLTAIQNLLLGSKLSEFHTGYRAYSRAALERLPWPDNSDDFVFDNQVLAQAIALDMPIGEISCPAKYFPEASSINFRRSLRYGWGVLGTSLLYLGWRWKLLRPRLFAGTPAARERAGGRPGP
jgi:glycosyltransferase involved in cell wall biosynthesis